MRLAEWRKEQGWTQDELAARLDCSQPFVSLIERASDPQIPGREWMIKIFKLTSGAVVPNDFYDLPPLGQMTLPFAVTDAPLLDHADPAVGNGNNPASANEHGTSVAAPQLAAA